MIRAKSRSRHLAEVGEFGFQAFDVKTNDPSAGENKRYRAARGVPFDEFDGKQIKPRILGGLIEITAFTGEDPLEAERGPAAPVIRLYLRIGVGHAHPIEPAQRHDETMIVWYPEDIPDLDQGVLDMRRNHLDVVFIEGDELEFVRARTHSVVFPDRFADAAKLVMAPAARKYRIGRRFKKYVRYL